MIRILPLLAGAATLGFFWLGPLADLSDRSFAAHMAVHMSVVAIAAPLLAWGIAGSRMDPVLVVPALFAPLPASIVEFLVVSAWHAPVLHHAARMHQGMFAFEQATFLASGLLLWLSAAGGAVHTGRWRAGAGAGALLFTSMHMTLLGALFALTPRVLYAHADTPGPGLTALADQHIGGAIMLLVGALSYLMGGLWLTAKTLAPTRRRATGLPPI